MFTLVMLNKDATPISNCQPVRLPKTDCGYKFHILMKNCADPNHLASSLFAKAGHIQVQQDND